MEHIKLIELDFDINKLKKNMLVVNKDVEDLTEKQNLLKKSSIGLGVEIEKKIALMKKAEAGNATNTASYSKLKKEVERLKEVQKLSNTERKRQLVETKSALKAKRKEERLGMQMVEAHTQKEQKNITIARQTKGSIDQISAALSQNRALYRSLTPEQRENSKIGKELLKVIDQQDKEYKKLNNDMGVTQVNVGNYKGEMQKAIATSFNLQQSMTALLGPFGSFVPLLFAGGKGLKAFALGNRAATTATSSTSKALRFFKIALLSTGIGAIVVALGALISYFASTQEGIDNVNKVLYPLKALFHSLIGVFQKVGKSLWETFSHPKKAIKDLWDALKANIVNRITGIIDTFKFLGKTIKAVFSLNFDQAKENAKKLGESVTRTLTGVKDFSTKMGNAAKNTSKFFSDAINKGRELADLKVQIEEKENDLIAKNAQLRADYEKQKEIAQNINLTVEERKKAAQEAVRLQDEILSGEQNILDLKIKEKKLQHSLNDTNREQKKELQELYAQRSQFEGQAAKKRASARNLEKTINKEAIASAKKRIDAELKASKTKIDIYIAENKDKAETLDGLLKYEEIVHKKKLALLKSELKNKKKTQEEYDLAVLNRKVEFAKRQAEIVSEHASKELDIYIAQHKSKIDSEKALTNDLVKAEEDRLQTIYDKKVAILEQQKSDGLISEQDYLLQRLQLQGEHLTAVDELEKGFNEQKKEQKAIDEENEKALKEIALEDELLSLQEKEDLKHQIKLDALQKERDVEIENAVKTGADLDKINKKYNALEEKENKRNAKAKKSIDKAVFDAKINIASQTFGNLATLLGKESEAGKAAAIAQATIETYKSATSAYSAMAGIPVVGPALGAVAAAAAVASGLKTVQQITSTSKPNLPKAEHGAVFPIGGNRHSAGGTKFYGEDGTAFEAERDEVLIVLNRAASSAFAGLSELNARHGGNAFNQTHRYLAGGGLVGRNSSITTVTTNNNAPGIDYDLLAQKIVEGNKSLPHPVTLVQDIIHETNIHNEIIDGSKF